MLHFFIDLFIQVCDIIFKINPNPRKPMKTVYKFTPCSNVVPYDYYGQLGAESIQEKLAKHGIQSTVEVEKRVANPIIGTGYKGRVRVGDEMLPSVYHIQVEDKFENKALSILSHNLNPLNRGKIYKLLAA